MPEAQHTAFTHFGSANIGATRITRTLAETDVLTDTLLRELGAAVLDYARVQRAVEVPPEAILAQAKQLVRQALPMSTPVETRNAIMEHVVEWCITAYYDETPVEKPGDAPSRVEVANSR